MAAWTPPPPIPPSPPNPPSPPRPPPHSPPVIHSPPPGTLAKSANTNGHGESTATSNCQAPFNCDATASHDITSEQYSQQSSDFLYQHSELVWIILAALVGGGWVILCCGICFDKIVKPWMRARDEYYADMKRNAESARMQQGTGGPPMQQTPPVQALHAQQGQSARWNQQRSATNYNLQRQAQYDRALANSLPRRPL